MAGVMGLAVDENSTYRYECILCTGAGGDIDLVRGGKGV